MNYIAFVMEFFFPEEMMMQKSNQARDQLEMAILKKTLKDKNPSLAFAEELKH